MVMQAIAAARTEFEYWPHQMRTKNVKKSGSVDPSDFRSTGSSMNLLRVDGESEASWNAWDRLPKTYDSE